MITLTQARDLLRRAVDTQGPDFVYRMSTQQQCMYVPDTEHPENHPARKTGCLIGVVLDLAGETRHHHASNLFADVSSLYQRYSDMMTYGAALYLGRAQLTQDNIGSTWGEAYQEAEQLITTYNLTDEG